MVTAIGGLEHFYKNAVTRSRCASLIILILKNGEKVPNDHNFLGCFFQLLKNKFTRLLNFITKNTVTTYLSTYLYVLNHFGWNGDWQ
jgi:hypothetical protein